MANKKKTNKSHIGLIVSSIIVAVILMLTIIILLITKPWSSNNNSTNDNHSSSRPSTSGKNQGKKMKIDENFVDQIKQHNYQPLKDTRNFSFGNNTKPYLKDQEGNSTVDGYFDIQIPNNWQEVPALPNAGGTFISDDQLDLFDIWTEAGYTSAGSERTVKEVQDQYLSAMPVKGDSYELIDQFTKEINGVEYLVAIEKYPTSDGGYMFDVVYSRMLTKSSYTQSVLMANVQIDENIDQSDSDKILKNIYDMENVLGSFEESEK